jgi:hypothetical protein
MHNTTAMEMADALCCAVITFSMHGWHFVTKHESAAHTVLSDMAPSTTNLCAVNTLL